MKVVISADTKKLTTALNDTKESLKEMDKVTANMNKKIQGLLSTKDKELKSSVSSINKEMKSLQKTIDQLNTKKIKIEAQSGQEQIRQAFPDNAEALIATASFDKGFTKVANGVDLPDGVVSEWNDLNAQLLQSTSLFNQLDSSRESLLTLLDGINNLREELEHSNLSTSELKGQLDMLAQAEENVVNKIGEIEGADEELLNIKLRLANRINDIIEEANKTRELIEQKKKQEQAEKQLNDTKRLGTDISKRYTKEVSRLLSAFKRLILYKALRFVFSSISSGMNEGLNNAYNFSRVINGSLAPSLDRLKTSTNTMKNSFGAMAGSLIQTLLPAIMKVVEWLTKLANVINQVVAGFSGRKTFTKAKDVTASWSTELDNANSSAKKLKKTIMGFDEMNILNGQDDAGAIDLASGYGDMFEEVPVDEKLAEIGKKIRKFYDTYIVPVFQFIMDHIKEIAIALAGFVILKTIIGWIIGIANAVTTVKNVVSGVTGVIKLIGTALTGPLGTVMLIVGAIALVVAGFITMYKTSDEFRERVDAIWNDSLKPALEQLWATIQELWGYIEPVLKQLWEIIKQLWVELLAPILGEIGIMIMQLLPIVIDVITSIIKVLEPIFEVISALLTALQGVIDFIVGIFTGDIEGALEGLKTFFKGAWDSMVAILKTFCVALESVCEIIVSLVTNIVKAIANAGISIYNAMVNVVQSMINFVIKGLNKFLEGVCKVVNKVGSLVGANWNVNWTINPVDLSGIKANYLAKGGIIDRPTLSMIGEDGKEAVVPLENNTAWMDKLAEKLTSKQPTKLVMVVDGKELGYATINNINAITKQTGSLQLTLA